MTDITEKLDRLADMQSQRDVLDLHYQDLRNSLISPELAEQLNDIEFEKNEALIAVDRGIASLTEEIKADVLKAGKTVKGAHLQAVWNKPRVSWDSRLLDGLAIALPQITAARREGEPSVTLRRAG